MNFLLREPNVFESEIVAKSTCYQMWTFRLCEHRALVWDITIAFEALYSVNNYGPKMD